MKAVALKPQVVGSMGIIEAPKPEIGPRDVLVKTLSVGIDGTDIEINSGAYGQAPPGQDILIIGHEAIREVESVGSEVTGLTPEYLVKVPEELKPVGALMEPMSVAQKAIEQAFDVQKRVAWEPKTCLVLGAGRHSGEICPDCLNNQLVLGNRAMFGSVSSGRRHFEQAVETAKFAEHNWPGILESMITQPLDLENFKQAFEARDRRQIKSVVYFH